VERAAERREIADARQRERRRAYLLELSARGRGAGSDLLGIVVAVGIDLRGLWRRRGLRDHRRACFDRGRRRDRRRLCARRRFRACTGEEEESYWRQTK